MYHSLFITSLRLMRAALLSWNTIVANDTKATKRNENKKTEIPTGAFTTKLAEYTLMIYHETGVAIINASKNVALYLRPKRRYKSYILAPFTFLMAISR